MRVCEQLRKWVMAAVISGTCEEIISCVSEWNAIPGTVTDLTYLTRRVARAITGHLYFTQKKKFTTSFM